MPCIVRYSRMSGSPWISDCIMLEWQELSAQVCSLFNFAASSIMSESGISSSLGMPKIHVIIFQIRNITILCERYPKPNGIRDWITTLSVSNWFVLYRQSTIEELPQGLPTRDHIWLYFFHSLRLSLTFNLYRNEQGLYCNVNSKLKIPPFH